MSEVRDDFLFTKLLSKEDRDLAFKLSKELTDELSSKLEKLSGGNSLFVLASVFEIAHVATSEVLNEQITKAAVRAVTGGTHGEA